ncbi:alpha-1,6-mannosyl-glycoprotein 2-beta-N-acetylglucosaminyltransferase-like isoform X2 [Palaemon carinicauda]|uniref:alpha-1,6-mannosyl-glycoprotein 2-beta-N-acetylglucosaminyltransferase-like isoform X2 n=1 Tax=Palaemon carinicauda TaxID=392227 RepID=UPI0035B665B5
MRWRRSCKRLMILLMFICMTIKLHLEFRLLDTTKANSFSPWWTNETLGHLRGFPKAKGLPRGNLTAKDASSKYGLGVGGEKRLQSDANDVAGLKVSDAGPKVGDAGPKVSDAGPKVSDAGLKVNETSRSVGAVLESETTKSNSSLSTKDNKRNNNTNPKKGFEADLHMPRPPLTHIHSKLKISNENKETRKEAENILHPQVAKSKEDITPRPQAEAKPQPKLLPMPHPRQALRPGPKKKTAPRRGVSHDVDPQEMSLTPKEIEKIKRKLEELNEEQTIYNENTYGPILRNTTTLLVQVHNRLENLRYLVESMKNTRGINETLVIFSHDYWYPAMNDFVTNITEFRVMQMFFPFSIQLHPHKFPGRDPRDCSWNVNRVFHDLRATKVNYTGQVVFLEEDHYILPDLLYVLSVLQKQRITHCSSCQVLALGNYNKMSPSVYKNFVERGDWWVTKHNLGFALDKTAWNSLATCKNQFCQFDDYNWDWTLNNIIQTCFKPRMSMLSVKFSRVIHVGSCGTHVKKRTCDVKKEVQAAKTRINLGREWLFPKHLAYQNVYRGSGRVKKGNGGWGDFRDRQLCRAIWNGTVSEETLKRLEMNQFG